MVPIGARLQRQRELRGRRDPAGREGGRELPGGPGFLAVEMGVPAQAEDPGPPPVAGRPGLRRLLEGDRDPGGDGRPGHVTHQAHLEGVDQTVADLVLGVRSIGIAGLGVVDPREFVLADERQRVLAPSASRLQGRDKDVDLGFLAVPDIIHEGDLGPDVIDVAIRAVDEDPRRGLLQLLDRRRPVRLLGQDGGGEEGRESEDEGKDRDHPSCVQHKRYILYVAGGDFQSVLGARAPAEPLRKNPPPLR